MDSALTVYIDFKSPYAYLAVEPTRRLARELAIQIDWMPFVLDIPSYLGSARLDKSGKVAAQSRSDSQWSMVKYAYADCRRYARLRDKIIRGTVKIWDTNLAAIGMLWAKHQGEDILHRYTDGIYAPFWRRELDLEDVAVVEGVLADAGAAIEGFRAFSLAEGLVENESIQEAAFDRGIFGVPTYVLGEELYFGREHLPRIRWLLQGAVGACPDIAYELEPGSHIEPAEGAALSVGIGLEDPESLLAIPEILASVEDLDIELSWYALPEKGPGRQHDGKDQSRGGRHRRYRTENRRQDRHRYCGDDATKGDIPGRVVDLLRQNNIEIADTTPPDSGQSPVSAPGYVGSPVFMQGQEVYVGRQHLPLIRARFERR
jgi:2-hydroxychromene-2-carboxylate isomerase